MPAKTGFGWGGWRPGAGRKPGPNPRVRHRSREAFRGATPAHVTIPVVPGLPSLRTLRIARAIAETFARGCTRPDFRLVRYALEPSSVQLIVETRDPDALGRGMIAIGARLARAINRALERRGRVLADRFGCGSCPRRDRRTRRFARCW